VHTEARIPITIAKEVLVNQMEHNLGSIQIHMPIHMPINMPLLL
jgi:hypothetical protein